MELYTKRMESTIPCYALLLSKLCRTTRSTRPSMAQENIRQLLATRGIIFSCNRSDGEKKLVQRIRRTRRRTIFVAHGRLNTCMFSSNHHIHNLLFAH
ncbi:hypothetical protein NY2A_b707R [Paramecium bursaria Chlorella virus NY2A]|uniref:Uncharacterized protein b707R n=1 Tax=Paramecium bursaria Chlorella virus NY2A TaxID=46021 RepID=A7IXN2_PBCVN|nr:hypothetical protein NY2A_b707R [Paramecium bursaria Chlorella virus NY2A]ABT15106.1 hypothetical protein NY2A_b707R [Paramecium bursaria Chlorella virus NY2A]